MRIIKKAARVMSGQAAMSSPSLSAVLRSAQVQYSARIRPVS